jgi:hypothetical protein
MLSIRPQHVEPAYEIIVIDHADDQALVPVRNIRQLAGRRRRGRRRVVLITAAAAALCAAVGFGAGLLVGRVPAPQAPEPPPALSSVRSWLASAAPVRVEPLLTASAAGGAPLLGGWVAGSDLGGRGLTVRLLESDGPVTTLAIELHAEPRMATLRGVSSRAFDIEIGPVAGAVRAQELAPPDGMPFVRRVTVRKQTGFGEGLVRVRVNLDVPGLGNLRVVGRTIYADFAARSAAS